MIHVSWNVVNGSTCNLKCKHCFAAFDSDRRVLTLSQKKALLEKLAYIGTNRIDFAGGEPLLENNLIELINHAKQCGITNIGIITNGTLIDDCFCQKIKGIVNYISISIDGVCSESNDLIRGSNVFLRVNKALDCLKKWDIKFTLSYTLMRTNIHEARNIVTFAKNSGANSLVIQIIENFGRAKYYFEEIGLTEEEGLKAYCNMFFYRPNFYVSVPTRYYFKDFLSHFFNYEADDKNIGFKKCEAGINKLVVSSEGFAYPCNLYQNSKKLCTKYGKLDLLKDIYIQETMQKFKYFNKIINIHSKIKYSHFCSNCKYNKICNPCILTETNDYNSMNECMLTKKLWNNMLENIMKSKLKLLKPYSVDKLNNLVFKVNDQKKPIILNIDKEDFLKIFEYECVLDIIKSNFIDCVEETDEFIKFLCKLRSYHIIEISHFWDNLNIPSAPIDKIKKC